MLQHTPIFSNHSSYSLKLALVTGTMIRTCWYMALLFTECWTRINYALCISCVKRNVAHVGIFDVNECNLRKSASLLLLHYSSYNKVNCIRAHARPPLTGQNRQCIVFIAQFKWLLTIIRNNRVEFKWSKIKDKVE